MAWRLADSLERLRSEVNAAAPSRSTRSDGTIGDASHAASASDHNPNGAGVVCALDLTHDPDSGADMHKIAEQVRKSGHPALKYIIWNDRIYSVVYDSQGWRYYGGSNPHTSHMHVSVGVGSDGRSTGPYDNTSSWGISASAGGDDNMSFLGYGKGDSGPHIQDFQKFLSDCGYPPADSFASGKWDGIYGKGVAAAVLECRIDNGSEVDPNGTGGDKISYWANNQLRRAHFRAMLKRFS